MACQEIAQMRREVCDSLHNTVNHWQYNLQAKWGDPSVYQAEEEERLRQDARMVYDLNRRNTALLSEAYSQQADRQRDNHKKRMENLKRRGYRSASKHLESADPQMHSQSSPPSPQPPPAQPADSGRPVP